MLLGSIYSLLIGVVIAVIPILLFGLIFFKLKLFTAKQIVAVFYLGEFCKLVCFVLLFTSVLYCMPCKPMLVFTAIVITNLLYWVCCLISLRGGVTSR